jgi:hypothetical protein
MSTVKAYAINTIVHRDPATGSKVTVEASTKQKVSVFDLNQGEFDKLVALGAVREATKEEVAIAKVQSNEVSDAPTNEEKIAAADKKVPASGADGDPQGKPKGAAKVAAKVDAKVDEI